MRFNDLWWLLLLRGIFLILFGLVAIFWPAITFVTLALAFAFFIAIAGVINIVHAVLGITSHRYWFMMLALGVFEVGVGAYALNNLGLSIAALALLIGFTFIIRGVFEVIGAFDDMFRGTTRMLLLVSGILAAIAGIIILRYPETGTVAFTWVMGVYALIAGAITVALSITVKEVVGEVLERRATRRVRNR